MHTKQNTPWHDLHDGALIEKLRAKLAEERRTTAEVLALIAEVDRRRLYAQAACDSMFSYATSVLGMSEAAAYKRIQVARAARRYPSILERVADGRVHLSGLCVLVPHLTAENHVELLDAASRLGKRRIEQFVAERFPRPEVRTSLHRQPERSLPVTGAQPRALEVALCSAQRTMLPATAMRTSPAEPGRGNAATARGASGSMEDGSVSGGAPSSAAFVRPPVVHTQQHPQPLGPGRYLLKVTLSSSVCDKLRRCQDLLAGQVPDGDIATVLEAALDALVAKQLKRKYAVGVTARREATPSEVAAVAGSAEMRARDSSDAARQVRSRAIPAAIRRAVYQRDGGQCCYVDPQTGRRCRARRRLEFHHRLPFARGGAHSSSNVCLVCATHNGEAARRDFGAAQIEAVVAARRSAVRRSDLPRGELSGGGTTGVGLTGAGGGELCGVGGDFGG